MNKNSIISIIISKILVNHAASCEVQLDSPNMSEWLMTPPKQYAMRSKSFQLMSRTK